jgi:hypothetical protein
MPTEHSLSSAHCRARETGLRSERGDNRLGGGDGEDGDFEGELRSPTASARL